jgi:hypothetical protein
MYSTHTLLCITDLYVLTGYEQQLASVAARDSTELEDLRRAFSYVSSISDVTCRSVSLTLLMHNDNGEQIVHRSRSSRQTSSDRC